MNEDRTPILVGAAQLTQKDVDPAGATEKLLERVDCVGVVNILGHDYGNARRAKPQLYTAIGGNSPQFLLNAVPARSPTDASQHRLRARRPGRPISRRVQAKHEMTR